MGYTHRLGWRYQSMKKPLFTGVCTALVTPFLGGNVNYPMMDLLLRRQVDAGIEAVVLCGTTGESPTLSDLEKLEMFRRGKKRIGFIGECMHCTSFYERYMAYRNVMYLLNLPCPDEYCIIKNKEGLRNPSYADYREYLAECIKKLEQLPDVFICANDFVALDVMKVLKELGYSVPEDVYLCGFDDSPESKIITPSLTTIHIHSQIMGFSAVHLLMSRINEPSLNYRTIHTETSLIYRESTEN